jgi:hypothetical protein
MYKEVKRLGSDLDMFRDPTLWAAEVNAGTICREVRLKANRNFFVQTTAGHESRG